MISSRNDRILLREYMHKLIILEIRKGLPNKRLILCSNAGDIIDWNYYYDRFFFSAKTDRRRWIDNAPFVLFKNKDFTNFDRNKLKN